MQMLIKERRTDIEVEIYQRSPLFGKDDSLFEGIIFHCTPFKEIYNKLFELASKKNIHCIGAGYSAINAIDIAVYDFFIPNKKFDEESTAAWVGSGALSAIMAIYSAFVQPLNFVGSIHKLNMPKEETKRALEDFTEHT
jgi:hypothetical protein